MRVCLVVFSYRYTGAAAVAEHCSRALLEVGVEVCLLFTGGDNLELRLAGRPWARPVLRKERGPGDVIANLKALRAAAHEHDALLCHLPHDHFLCLVARARRHATLVRSFRSPGHLRPDPFHRLLARRTDGALLAHRRLAEALDRLAPDLPRIALPVPTEARFSPGDTGSSWRRRLAIPERAPVIGMVGKVAPGRGFELLLDAAAALETPARVVVIGHGEARPRLELRARELGLADRLHWAGYVEDDLPALLAALDVVLVTAAGSDHGHRAVSEAQACSRPVVAVELPGVEDLVEDRRTGRIVAPTPRALAGAVDELLADPDLAGRLGRAGATAVQGRRFAPVGRRLAEFLDELTAARRSRGLDPG